MTMFHILAGKRNANAIARSCGRNYTNLNQIVPAGVPQAAALRQQPVADLLLRRRHHQRRPYSRRT